MRNFLLLITVLVSGCGPSADDLCVEARKKLIDGKVMEAFAEYSRALEKDPKSSEAYNGIGNCYSAKEDYNKAFESYTKSIELDPSNPKPYTNRSNIYVRRKEYLEAYRDATKAVDLDKSNDVCYAMRSNTLAIMERYDEALVDIDKAIEIAPENADYYDYRANIYLRMKEFDKALEDTNKSDLCTKTSRLGISLEFAKSKASYKRALVQAIKGDNENLPKELKVGFFNESQDYINKSREYLKRRIASGSYTTYEKEFEKEIDDFQRALDASIALLKE